MSNAKRGIGFGAAGYVSKKIIGSKIPQKYHGALMLAGGSILETFSENKHIQEVAQGIAANGAISMVADLAMPAQKANFGLSGDGGNEPVAIAAVEEINWDLIAKNANAMRGISDPFDLEPVMLGEGDAPDFSDSGNRDRLIKAVVLSAASYQSKISSGEATDESLINAYATNPDAGNWLSWEIGVPGVKGSGLNWSQTDAARIWRAVQSNYESISGRDVEIYSAGPYEVEGLDEEISIVNLT